MWAGLYQPAVVMVMGRSKHGIKSRKETRYNREKGKSHIQTYSTTHVLGSSQGERVKVLGVRVKAPVHQG